MDELQRRIDNLFNRPIEAETGRYLSAASSVLDPDIRALEADGVSRSANRVYVRVHGARSEMPVWNNGKFVIDNRSKPPVSVRIAKNEAGEWEIIGGNSQKLDISHKEAAGTVLTPARTADLDDTPVNGRRLKVGRPHIWVTGTLKVNAAEFEYIDSAGVKQIWTPSAGTALDIASSVPSASGGFDRYRWVQIALDVTAGAAALVALNGDIRYVQQYVTGETIYSAINSTGYLPLDYVRLVTGDVDETTVNEERWAFGRILLGQRREDAIVVISGDGAITIAPSTVALTKTSAAAITLAAPTAGLHDGLLLRVYSETAFAHVITSGTDGFNAKGSSGTATFGAAKGNAITLVARNGHWWSLSTIGVTFA